MQDGRAAKEIRPLLESMSDRLAVLELLLAINNWLDMPANTRGQHFQVSHSQEALHDISSLFNAAMIAINGKDAGSDRSIECNSRALLWSVYQELFYSSDQHSEMAMLAKGVVERAVKEVQSAIDSRLPVELPQQWQVS